MEKLLITGGSGFLGRRCAAWFQNQGYPVLTPSHRELDITEEESLYNWFRENRPEAVIHMAAVSDTGLCQKNPVWSEKINVESCLFLARCCRAFGAKLVLCSSDQVYSGSTLPGPHREDEPVTPNNVYGNQKLRAEQRCLEILPDTVCLRLAWMYAEESLPGEHGHFLSTLLAALEDESKPLTWPIHDRRGITDVEPVVRNLEKALKLPGGVYNFGSENDADTFRTLWEVLDRLDLETAKARLVPNREAFAENPRDLTMDTGKIQAYGIAFPTTKQGLINALRKKVHP